MKMVNICTYFSSKESPRQSDFDGIFSVGREVFRLKETMVKVIIQKSCGLISASVVWARNRLHFPYLWDIIYRTDHTQDYYFAPLEKKNADFQSLSPEGPSFGACFPAGLRLLPPRASPWPESIWRDSHYGSVFLLLSPLSGSHVPNARVYTSATNVLCGKI